jgi:hypothetical protein
MIWDESKVLANIRAADTEDLLDRITVYRANLEAAAVEMIERELHRRGVSAKKIDSHREECLRECLFHDDGTAKMCSFCRKPAIREGWGWHRLMGTVPILPRWLRYCKSHNG